MDTSGPAKWFRLWAEFAEDPKVQRLSEVDQRRFIMILCLRCSKGQVTLLDDDVAFLLRIETQSWIETKKTLQERGLLGDDNLPLNWNKRQFQTKNDSAERVAKLRQKRLEAGLPSQVWISKKTRAEVLARDGGRCVYCGSTEEITIDHKLPQLRGGSNEIDNLQACCRTCNSDKGRMSHEEYLNWNGRVTLLVASNPAQSTEYRDRVKDKEPIGSLVANEFATPNSQAEIQGFEIHESKPPDSDDPIRCDPDPMADCPAREIVEAYHAECPDLPRVTYVTGKRQQAIRARWRELARIPQFAYRTRAEGIAEWRALFGHIAKSDFLCGRAPPGKARDRPFRASLDWIVTPGNFVKILEGNYHR